MTIFHYCPTGVIYTLLLVVCTRTTADNRASLSQSWLLITRLRMNNDIIMMTWSCFPLLCRCSIEKSFRWAMINPMNLRAIEMPISTTTLDNITIVITHLRVLICSVNVEVREFVRTVYISSLIIHPTPSGIGFFMLPYCHPNPQSRAPIKTLEHSTSQWCSNQINVFTSDFKSN